MSKSSGAHTDLQHQVELAHETTAALGIEISKLVDQLRWYRWISVGSVAAGLALGVLGAIEVAGG